MCRRVLRAAESRKSTVANVITYMTVNASSDEVVFLSALDSYIAR